MLLVDLPLHNSSNVSKKRLYPGSANSTWKDASIFPLFGQFPQTNTLSGDIDLGHVLVARDEVGVDVIGVNVSVLQLQHHARVIICGENVELFRANPSFGSWKPRSTCLQETYRLECWQICSCFCFPLCCPLPTSLCRQWVTAKKFIKFVLQRSWNFLQTNSKVRVHLVL